MSYLNIQEQRLIPDGIDRKLKPWGEVSPLLQLHITSGIKLHLMWLRSLMETRAAARWQQSTAVFLIIDLCSLV